MPEEEDRERDQHISIKSNRRPIAVRHSNGGIEHVEVTFSGSGTFQRDTESKSGDTANKQFVTGSQSMAALQTLKGREKIAVEDGVNQAEKGQKMKNVNSAVNIDD